DGEVAEADGTETEQPLVRVVQMLARELRDAVRVVRPRRHVLGCRVALGIAVDRRRARPHNRDPGLCDRLEHALRGEYVPPEVVREDMAEAARARLAREVEHGVERGEVEVRVRE